jgi:hypothetical protein
LDTALRLYQREKFGLPQNVLLTVANDRSLRFPQRKIIECLLLNYDYDSGLFRELHFNSVVKQAHVGKNAARDHLKHLEQSGYVHCRFDGYRKFFRIGDRFMPNGDATRPS